MSELVDIASNYKRRIVEIHSILELIIVADDKFLCLEFVVNSKRSFRYKFRCYDYSYNNMSCAVKTCKNLRRLVSEDITFHGFPKGEKQNEWLNILGIEKNNWEWKRYKYVCSNHFNNDDFIINNSGKRTLKIDAVPTLNLADDNSKPAVSSTTSDSVPSEDSCYPRITEGDIKKEIIPTPDETDTLDDEYEFRNVVKVEPPEYAKEHTSDDHYFGVPNNTLGDSSSGVSKLHSSPQSSDENVMVPYESLDEDTSNRFEDDNFESSGMLSPSTLKAILHVGCEEEDKTKVWSDKRKWPFQETMELISCYERKSILWDHTNKDYRNRVKKMKIYTELSVKFNCSVQEIQRKLHNLRNQVSLELKKCHNKKRANDEGFKSTWPYFKALSFIIPLLRKRGSKDSLPSTHNLPIETQLDTVMTETADTATETADAITGTSDSITENVFGLQNFSEMISNYSQKTKEETAETQDYVNKQSVQRKRKRKDDNIDDDDDAQLVEKAKSILRKEPNDSNRFGQYVAMELEGLSSDLKRKKLKMEIRKAILRIVEEDYTEQHDF